MQVDIFISGIFMTVVYPINAYLASGIYCLICILVVENMVEGLNMRLNINVLCRFQACGILGRSDDCFIQLLPCSHHHHEIHIESTVEEPHCGVIPISGPSKRSNTGLQFLSK
ncbi:UNVERIFIED_CONTAM: Thiamine pyrophosphokinase [Sesamum latifolium]|uniref:Thiamine pyrophosphokinase n=1 Tax=Sesamum latifolium TaxID=2727402 RepID=A0AAW2Y1U5_9LAMI